jgi:rare lipoprotein A (peptidoglycan hydrolase)
VSTRIGDTSINYTYETIPKKYLYEKDTQIGLLERELYKKTTTSTIEGVSYWYGNKFQGRKMANGEKFDVNDPTIVAHRSLKLGTKLKITNIKNGNIIYGIVKDRGPYTYKWITDKNGKKIKKYLAEIDVSYSGAKLLGFDKSGIGNVKIEVY